MQRVIRIVLLFALVCAFGGTAPGQQASPSPEKPVQEPTPIPLADILSNIQSAMTSLQEMDATASEVQSIADTVDGSFANLTGEIEPRMAEDTKLLQASPSLDMLYQTKLTWQDFGENLSVISRGLVQRIVNLEEELARLKQLDKSWQATLQLAKQTNVPPSAMQSVQSLIDSIEQTRQTLEASRARALTLLDRISNEQTRVRKTLALVERSQIQALKDLLVRDSPVIWNLKTGLGAEWENRSGESFVSQLKASTAFSKRIPFAFLLHASACRFNCDRASLDAKRHSKTGDRETRSRARIADPRSSSSNGVRPYCSYQSIDLSSSSSLDSCCSGDACACSGGCHP